MKNNIYKYSPDVRATNGSNIFRNRRQPVKSDDDPTGAIAPHT
jgi:hypothetical protein